MTAPKRCPVCHRMFSKKTTITRRQWEAQVSCSKTCAITFRGPWSPALIAELTALWSEGLPTSEIALRLGVTRNAVIGKAMRLDLEYHKTAATHNPHLRAA